ncbi:MAG: Asp23/Gls24 family envelope stress response protein [Ruminococcus sp.]|nr:Asp23/Gls24 family envelope stress response protein [Ruminococcus sp.]
MEVVKDKVNSRLKISDDVIITVTRLATLEVRGVAGLAGEVNVFSKIKNNPPIRITRTDESVSVDVKIKVVGTEKVRRIAGKVQKSVSEKIRTITGISVSQVNVIISGAVFD